MKKLLAIALLLSVGLNIYQLLGKEKVSISLENKVETFPKEKEDVVVQTPNIDTNNTQILESKVRELRVKVKNLTKSNSRKQDRIEELEELLANNDESQFDQESKSKATPSIGPSEEEAKKAIADRNSVIESFKNQNIDGSWSYKAQEQLSAIINNSELLSEMSFNGVECKSTICRMSVTPLNEGKGHKINAFFNISSALRDSDYGDYTTMSDNMGDSKEVHVYIIRPEDKK